jgi:AcrR family transcriptional regulator
MTRTRPVTRADVLDVALTLFAERGYHGTSLKQVAERLSISTPSLYNHMGSKGSLLTAIVLDTLEHVVADFDAAIAGTDDPVTQVRRATEVYALRHATHRRETLVVNHETVHLDDSTRARAQGMRRDHERRFRAIILRGQRDGVFDVESAKLASFAIREMCVSIARWFREGGEFTVAEVARQHAAFALGMLGVSEHS